MDKTLRVFIPAAGGWARAGAILTLRLAGKQKGEGQCLGMLWAAPTCRSSSMRAGIATQPPHSSQPHVGRAMEGVLSLVQGQT